MQKGLSRRKYARLVRFLTTVLDDPKETNKTKLAAAERLDGIYARHEARQDAALDRAERAAERAAAAQVQPDAPETTPTLVSKSESAEEAAERFLQTLRTNEGRSNA